MFDLGVFSPIHRASRNLLTVLNYHRVADSYSDDFFTFKPNVSASPDEFFRQMEYVKRFYNVISIDDLTLWIRGQKDLPPNPAIITFDDGYCDNLIYAQPVLKKMGFSAVIFLATNYMDGNAPFFWDLAAYCFCHTKKDRVRLPSGLQLIWQTPETRDKAVTKWVQIVKYLSSDEKKKAVDELVLDLDVVIPVDAFSGLYLNWDQVRELSSLGVEFGAHTASHPILTKVPLSQVEIELAVSKKRVEDEIGKKVLSFAYPNGGPLDFSSEVVDLVRKTGFEAAFTLLPGPVGSRSAQKDPFRIRRVYIGRSDTLPRIAAKLAGAERLLNLFE